jgi:hypothetical protein
MSLAFLNPLFLFGLAAAILPVLIHRITQKKIVKRDFSAVRLLLQSQRVTARPQRLKHLLLLALRILAVATLAFMMARPVLVRPGFASLLKSGAKVLILDNSLSMGYVEDRGRRYDVAKKAAREALEGFGGQVALIPTAVPGKGQDPRWMGPEEALRELEATPLSFGRGNGAAALASAYREVKNLKGEKQILIFSDMARRDWEGLDLTKAGLVSEGDVTFLRVGGPARDPNLCIKEVSLTDGDLVAGVPASLDVTVSNFSDQAGAALVQVSLSGVKQDQKPINLHPGGEVKVSFDLLVDNPGWMDGEVTLPSDRLASDDVFYFPLMVKEKVKVLVVDGDPGSSLKASESYFLVSALRPGGLEGSPFLTRIVTESEVDRVDLGVYDALFLLNVARPDLSRAASFLETGRPVFIFLGDRVVPEVYNTFSLAPWQIGERIDLDEDPGQMTGIKTDQGTLDLPARLSDPLKKASVRTYFKIEGSAKKLLTLSNQDPLLVTVEAGKSRLFLFASSADLDWNDLPLNAGYLPLVQGLVKKATGRAGPSIPADIKAGEPIGEEGPFSQIKGSQGGPGIFQFRLASGEVRRGVNVPYEESDLAKMGEDELKKKFGPVNVKVLEYREGELKDLQGGRKELWPALLVFLLALLFLELFLANGFARFGWADKRGGV